MIFYHAIVKCTTIFADLCVYLKLGPDVGLFLDRWFFASCFHFLSSILRKTLRRLVRLVYFFLLSPTSVSQEILIGRNRTGQIIMKDCSVPLCNFFTLSVSVLQIQLYQVKKIQRVIQWPNGPIRAEQCTRLVALWDVRTAGEKMRDNQYDKSDTYCESGQDYYPGS